MFEPNIQGEGVGDVSQASEQATANILASDELDVEGTADEPAVSLKNRNLVPIRTKDEASGLRNRW